LDPPHAFVFTFTIWSIGHQGLSVTKPIWVGAIDILYTLDSASLFSKIEAKNILAVTPISIDGGHVEVSHSLINAQLKNNNFHHLNSLKMYLE
jgi:hypothetical protein